MEYNPRHGITGVLCHGNGVFLQALEGDREEVNALYRAISRDARHHELVLLQFEEIVQRDFPGWSMVRVNAAKVNPATMLKYSTHGELDPYRTSGAASLAPAQGTDRRGLAGGAQSGARAQLAAPPVPGQAPATRLPSPCAGGTPARGAETGRQWKSALPRHRQPLARSQTGVERGAMGTAETTALPDAVKYACLPSRIIPNRIASLPFAAAARGIRSV